MNARVTGVLMRPEIRALLAKAEVEPAGNSPEEFAKFMSAETAKFAALIKAAGIRIE